MDKHTILIPTMKIIPSNKLISELINLINDANESLILISPYVDFEYRNDIKECIIKAIERNVEITFYIRAEVGSFQTWEQIDDLGYMPLFVGNLNDFIYYNEKHGLKSSVNLFDDDRIKNKETGYLTQTYSELEQLKQYVQTNIERYAENEDFISKSNIYFAKEKFIYILQSALSKQYDKDIKCNWNKGKIEFTVYDPFCIYLLKQNNIFCIEGSITPFEHDYFQIFKELYSTGNSEPELNESSILSGLNTKLSSGFLDKLTVDEKKDILRFTISFVKTMKRFKYECYLKIL
jgi:hypothetical protein